MRLTSILTSLFVTTNSGTVRCGSTRFPTELAIESHFRLVYAMPAIIFRHLERTFANSAGGEDVGNQATRCA